MTNHHQPRPPTSATHRPNFVHIQSRPHSPSKLSNLVPQKPEKHTPLRYPRNQESAQGSKVYLSLSNARIKAAKTAKDGEIRKLVVSLEPAGGGVLRMTLLVWRHCEMWI